MLDGLRGRGERVGSGWGNVRNGFLCAFSVGNVNRVEAAMGPSPWRLSWRFVLRISRWQSRRHGRVEYVVMFRHIDK
jgi:hypothetical protein